MKEQLISFETAKLAKESGFKIKTSKFYRVVERMATDIKYFGGENDKVSLVNYNNQFESCWDDFSAPTQALLQKWLREDKNKYVIVLPNDDIFDVWHYRVEDRLTSGKGLLEHYNSYEEALEGGLKEALEKI